MCNRGRISFSNFEILVQAEYLPELCDTIFYFGFTSSGLEMLPVQSPAVVTKCREIGVGDLMVLNTYLIFAYVFMITFFKIFVNTLKSKAYQPKYLLGTFVGTYSIP